MKQIFPPLKNKPLFALDFSLAYVGIVILGLSIATTELLKVYPDNKFEVLQVRLIHTFFLVVFVLLTHKVLIGLKVEKLSYLGLCVLGVWIALPSLIVRIYLMNTFDLIPTSQALDFFINNSIPSLGQALFWIPVVIILGGQRSAIFGAFKDYEGRLVSTARQTIRESNSFLKAKNQIDESYRDELNKNSGFLLESLNAADDKNLTLEERNTALQSHLRINPLREFSRWLNQKSESVTYYSKFEQEFRTLSLISKQFNILHNLIARKAPLPAWAYTLISFMLILPNYVLFYSLNQVILFLPGFIIIQIVAIQINRILKRGGKYAILQSNFLIVLIGYLPLIEGTFVRLLFDLGSANFPFAIVGISYPIGFFVYMRFIQIVQPRAVVAITNDEIYASPALKGEITKIVNDEFEQSMSHQWATYIHGKILTRLAATSLKLEQAVSNNDVEGFESCLKNLRVILQNPTSEFGIVSLPLDEEIASRLDPWEGLISINVDIEPELKVISNERVRDLGEVIEEVISNSVRHGGSQNIMIKLTREVHPDIHVHIEDDAVNPLPIGQSRVGLGTKILNLVTDGRWSISHLDGKTTVDLSMSLLEKRI
jgi:hypothetical protein